MPQIFKIGSYVVFGANEGRPLEPIQIKSATGKAEVELQTIESGLY